MKFFFRSLVVGKFGCAEKTLLKSLILCFCPCFLQARNCVGVVVFFDKSMQSSNDPVWVTLTWWFCVNRGSLKQVQDWVKKLLWGRISNSISLNQSLNYGPTAGASGKQIVRRERARSPDAYFAKPDKSNSYLMCHWWLNNTILIFAQAS